MDAVPKNYYKLIADNKDISRGLMMLNSCVASLKASITRELAEFNTYSFLWLDDRDQVVEVSRLGAVLCPILEPK